MCLANQSDWLQSNGKSMGNNMMSDGLFVPKISEKLWLMLYSRRSRGNENVNLVLGAGNDCQTAFNSVS